MILLSEIDPRINSANKSEDHMYEDFNSYMSNPGHVVQILRKLPEFLTLNQITKSKVYLEIILKSQQYFLKARVKKLSGSIEVINLLREIFNTCNSDGEFIKLESGIEEVYVSPIKNPQNEAEITVGDVELFNFEDEMKNVSLPYSPRSEIEDLERMEIACMIQASPNISKKETELLDKIERESISEIEHEDREEFQENLEIEPSCINQDIKVVNLNAKSFEEPEPVEIPYEIARVEHDFSNLFTSNLNISTSDLSLKSPYRFHEGFSFSSFERSEKFRSLSRSSNHSNSKSSLLQKFYKKSGFDKTAPQIRPISTIIENPDINEIDTPSFTVKETVKKRALSPMNINKPNLSQYFIKKQFSTGKLLSTIKLNTNQKYKEVENAQEQSENSITKSGIDKMKENDKSTQDVKRKHFMNKAKMIKTIESRFQVYLENKLKQDNIKINQLQAISYSEFKSNSISDFRGLVDSTQTNKNCQIFQEAKESFFTNVSSDRNFKKTLARAEQKIEEEQTRLNRAQELKEAHSEIMKEKQKLLKLLSKYYK